MEKINVETRIQEILAKYAAPEARLMQVVNPELPVDQHDSGKSISHRTQITSFILFSTFLGAMVAGATVLDSSAMALVALLCGMFLIPAVGIFGEDIGSMGVKHKLGHKLLVTVPASVGVPYEDFLKASDAILRMNPSDTTLQALTHARSRMQSLCREALDVPKKENSDFLMMKIESSMARIASETVLLSEIEFERSDAWRVMNEQEALNGVTIAEAIENSQVERDNIRNVLDSHTSKALS